jgi:alanyl-tRNA synthetase
MTDRLYYHDSFLFDFDARILESLTLDGKQAIVLDRTAFYPTSGGQVSDTGKLIVGGREVPVIEVRDEEAGRIFHFVAEPIAAGTAVRGSIDRARRCDHIQQHSGQHVLSASFLRLFNTPTVSFHMGAESCTIDLETPGVTAAQAEQAERLANEIVLDDRPATVRFVSLDEARGLGLRKLPPKQSGDLRLIDIQDFDLTACGGTHVRSTGQIGAILLRKTEKVKQGVRVEFVCGLRAVAAARKDYVTLSEAAGIYSAHIHDLPQQVRKSLEENKLAGKAQQRLLEEIATLEAARMLREQSGSPRIIVRVLPDREAVFTKLLAQRLTAGAPDVVALLAGGAGQPTLVFAKSPAQKQNMGQLMKDAMSELGGRGGGTADLAQGGIPPGKVNLAQIENLLRDLASRL